MPVVYKEIDRQDVVNIHRAKGYGQHGDKRFAYAVNKATGRRFQSGSEERVFAWGVRQEQYDLIMRHAEDAEDAARRLEASGLGNEQFAPTTTSAPMDRPSVSMEMVERLIENRVSAEVSRGTQPMFEAIHKMQTEVAELAKVISLAISSIQQESVNKMPKKRGRPLGSKNKPKEPKPDEATAAQQA